MGQEAEEAEAVVGFTDDDALLGESSAIVREFGFAACEEATAVVPHVDGKIGFGGGGSGQPNVEVEAVFAGLGIAHELQNVAEDVGLHAGGAEFVGGSYA